MSGIKAFVSREGSRGLGALGLSNRMIDEAKREAWWWFEARRAAVRRRTPLVAGSAVLWNRLSYAELVPVEVPLAGRGEVTVDVLSSAVSLGTERANYLRLPNTSARGFSRPGYSAAGVVRAIGGGVRGFAAGDLVAVRGASHASIVTVPASHVYGVPAEVSATDACLIQLGIISAQGVGRAAVAPDECVCVIGAGLVGILAQRLALAAGAGETTVVARSRRKERFARAAPGSGFLLAGEERPEVEALGASVVIEASGDPDALELAVAAAGDRGRIVLLGSPRGTTSNLPVTDIRRKRLQLIGAHVETLTYESAISGEDAWRREAQGFLTALAERRLDVGDLLSRMIDPRETANFYRELAQDRDIVGARFDWTLLPPPERARPARAVRLPDISGRGADSRGRPLPPSGLGARRREQLDDDPFAGARGDLRIGLLGCGDIAVHNAAAIAMAPNTRVTACFDPLQELADDIAGAHQAAAVTSAEALCDRDDVDAVFLSVPHHLHAPLATLAADAGKHVIVEKPPANDLAGALEIVAAAERNGVSLSFCFPQRYQPSVIAARRFIEQGALGEFAGTIAKQLYERSAAYRLGGFSGRAISGWRNRRDLAGGGALIMNLSHYVDLVRHLAGVEVEELAAFTAGADPAAEVEDSVTVSVRFANGAIGTFFASTEVRGTLSPELSLWGRDGHVVLEPRPKLYTVAPIEGFRTSRWQDFGRLPADMMRALYVSNFASAVAEGRPPDVTPGDGLAAQALIEAAYTSAETGGNVRPGDLLKGALTC
jgi:predicted dehydrogenase/threonine dehydrogenase-like Zn-dependent dehydrogenase